MACVYIFIKNNYFLEMLFGLSVQCICTDVFGSLRVLSDIKKYPSQ